MAGKQAKSITVRIEPRLKWGLELLARKQRRTMSSVVEWAILRVIEGDDGLEYYNEKFEAKSNLLNDTWDIEEPERIAKLAFNAAHLLTYEEEVIWKAAKDSGLVWKGHYNKSNEWEWTPWADSLNMKRLREYWPIIKKVAQGEEPRSKLPQVAAAAYFDKLRCAIGHFGGIKAPVLVLSADILRRYFQFGVGKRTGLTALTQTRLTGSLGRLQAR